MIYIAIFLGLFVSELLYFKIADRYNIIDKPNLRSSHSEITLRGGGIVFYFGAITFFFLSDFQYPWFFLGLTLMTAISFLDDIFTLSNKIRLVVHFTSVMLLAYQLDLFSMPWYYLIITFVFTVGVINAYNFMDGINGITACYSLSVGALLLLVNTEVNFIAQDLLIYTLLGVLVFAFFNFRNKAKCFAGDVGAVAIAFILLFALASLIFHTGNYIYILFLAVYGIDVCWTIIRRLILKENIFEAHRSHLYQYLGNEMKINKLCISFIYGLLQFLIGIGIIYLSKQNIEYQFLYSALIIGLMSISYLLFKRYILNKFVKNS